jgi:hypothetical protein
MGHHSLDSLKNKKVGEQITEAETFAELGYKAENGGWPTHLQF